MLSAALTCDNVKPRFSWNNVSHSSKYECKLKKHFFDRMRLDHMGVSYKEILFFDRRRLDHIQQL
jgi:hypothetical protein